MTGKLIGFFNILANLAARSITFAGTSCKMQRVKLLIELNDFGDYFQCEMIQKMLV